MPSTSWTPMPRSGTHFTPSRPSTVVALPPIRPRRPELSLFSEVAALASRERPSSPASAVLMDLYGQLQVRCGAKNDKRSPTLIMGVISPEPACRFSLRAVRAQHACLPQPNRLPRHLLPLAVLQCISRTPPSNFHLGINTAGM